MSTQPFTDEDVKAAVQRLVDNHYDRELDADDLNEVARIVLYSLHLRGRLRVPTDGHPEDYCHRCGGPNICWSAPSPLWNQVMRGGSINGPWQYDEIICPICFVQLAEAAGIADMWRLIATRVHVELETVTPSGRVWNEQTCMWDEPA